MKPSDAEQSDDALLRRGELFDGIGRRRIIHPEDVGAEKPRLLGYTRATSYIGALEDSTSLEKWRTRLILEGADEARLEAEVLTAYSRLLEDESAAFVEAEKLDGVPRTKTRRAEIIDQPGKTYRKRLDEIAEHAFFLAGGRDSADYGTAHHDLMEAHLTGTLTPEFAAERCERWEGLAEDFDAFVREWGRFADFTGATVEHMEALVVNDRLQVAGRTDIIVKCRMPGEPRARRMIMDLKTGKINGEARLSQQLALYAGSKRYDPETGERSDLRVRQDIGVIIHAPKGEARVEFKIVQLATGRANNALVAKVRASRRKVPGLVTDFDLDGA